MERKWKRVKICNWKNILFFTISPYQLQSCGIGILNHGIYSWGEIYTAWKWMNGHLYPTFCRVTQSEKGNWWVWTFQKSGTFTTGYLTKQLASTGNMVKFKFYKLLRRGQSLKDVKFLIWELSQACINTFDRLLWKSPWITISPSCCH